MKAKEVTKIRARKKIRRKKVSEKVARNGQTPRRAAGDEHRNTDHLFDSPFIFSSDREDESRGRQPREDAGDSYGGSTIFGGEF